MYILSLKYTFPNAIFEDVINVRTNNYKDAISEKGFSGKLKLVESTIYELRLEDAVYNGKNVDIDVKNRFVYHPLGVSE